jgi:cell wall-associated NlpC family hydrolase
VNRRSIGPIIIGLMVIVLLAFLIVPMLVIGGGALLFAGGNGADCGTAAANAVQPGVSTEAANSVPANYLKWFQKVGLQYNVSWTILAGIGKVESDDGRTTLPGVTSGQNGFGAAGPMQIGIEGASTNAWGGAPIHPASEVVAGVATDEDGDGVADVYDAADAIAGAAKYLVAHGVQQNPAAAIFAYNHADWYVQEVLNWASTYASGGFTIADTTQGSDTGLAAAGAAGMACTQDNQLSAFVAPNAIVNNAVNYAEAQLGKPYLWGGTGPTAFDCSGLVMEAYLSAGVNIPRTSQAQWLGLPHVPANQVQNGDLVFFAGSDGTPTSPGHVGLVVGKNLMIEAYAAGTPIRVSSFGTAQSPPGDNVVVGFAQPWPANTPATAPTATPTTGPTTVPTATPTTAPTAAT